METWSSKLPKALAKQHRSNMRLVVWNHVITWSCRGLFVYILRYAKLVFNLPLHSLASAPRGRMASGARSCEARVMQEPSCEGLRQPERPKGPRQPHPPTQRLICKWRALMWGTRHAGALLWGAPAARTTKRGHDNRTLPPYGMGMGTWTTLAGRRVCHHKYDDALRVMFSFTFSFFTLLTNCY